MLGGLAIECVITAAFPVPFLYPKGTERAVDTNLTSEDRATLRSDPSAEARDVRTGRADAALPFLCASNIMIPKPNILQCDKPRGPRQQNTHRRINEMIHHLS